MDNKARIQELAERVSKGNLAKELRESDGWQLIEDILNEEVTFYVNRFLNENTHPKEYAELKANINANKKLIRRLDVYSRAVPQAIKELRRLESDA